MNNKDISNEQQHLDNTIQKIEDYTYLLSEENDRKEEQMRTQGVMPGDRNTYQNNQSYQQLMQSAKKEPYFGSFETLSEKEGHEKWYIGKHGIYDQDQNLIVVDWRMPITSVFYNFISGRPRQQYQVTLSNGETDTHEMDVLSKKEYSINNQKIKKIDQQVAEIDSKLNVAITEEGESTAIRDEFLRNIVESRETTGYMKDIVATIQREQNKAIREPLNKNLIVQGVAGSGKSAIALHRLSYLLYNNPLIKPENTLIIGPSKLFISSMKELLPELEIEHVDQSTVTDLMLDMMGEQAPDIDLNLTTYFENILLEDKLPEQRKMIEFKGSSQIINLIDRFVDAFIMNYEDGIPSIEMFSYVLSKEKLKSIYNGYKYLPFFERIARFINHVKNYFDEKRQKRVTEINTMYESIESFFKSDSGLSKKEINKSLQTAEKARKNKLSSIKSEYNTRMTQWERKIKVDNVSALYKQFLSKEMIQSITSDQTIHDLFKNQKQYKLNYFDLAALCYMYMALNADYKTYSHLVIDEGQDLSLAHYSVLKKMAKTMTILGDTEQSIYGNYGQSSWEELMKHPMFDDEKISKLILETSYRSTKQIIEAANQVLENYFVDKYAPITPLNRGEEEVAVTEVKDGADLWENIIHVLKDWKKKYKRIAVIHNEKNKAQSVAEQLQKEFDENVVYVNPDKEIQANSISVLTSYDSKGMEFDAVIMYNVNEESYPNDEVHAKLLYVLVTRAQHELKIFYNDKLSPLLEGIAKQDEVTAGESFYDQFL